MEKDEMYMKLAIEQAKKGMETGEWPFGAVLVCGDEIIAEAHVTEGATKNVLDHAESKVVSEACNKLGTNELRDCTIYCSNEPCLMCAAAIFQAKIPRVVIGVSRSDLPHLLRERKLHIEDAADDSGYEIEIVRDVLKDEAIKNFEKISK